MRLGGVEKAEGCSWLAWLPIGLMRYCGGASSTGIVAWQYIILFLTRSSIQSSQDIAVKREERGFDPENQRKGVLLLIPVHEVPQRGDAPSVLVYPAAVP